MPRKKKEVKTISEVAAERVKRKRRKKAEMPPKYTTVDGVYSPPTKEKGPKSICPLCYSNPSVKLRQQKRTDTSERKWAMTETEVKVGRKKLKAFRILYPCSNTNCHTHIAVYSDVIYNHLQPYIESKTIAGTKAAEYLAGMVGPDGIWTAVALATPTVEARGAKDPMKRRRRRSR